MWAAVTTQAGTNVPGLEAPQPDPSTASPDHSGLAAKRVVAGALGGIAVAAIALAQGASWSVAALGATDDDPVPGFWVLFERTLEIANIKASANKYFNDKEYYESVMLPENAAPAPAPKP